MSNQIQNQTQQQQKQRVVQLSIAQANQMMGGVQATWYGLDMQGWYLPSIGSPCINCKYLLDLATNRCFRIKKEEIKQGTLLKSKRENSLKFFHRQLKMPQQRLAYKLFSKPEEFQQSIQMTENDFQLLKSLDTSMARPKQIRFFWITEQQIMDLKMKKKERKLKTELKKRSMAENYEVMKQKRQALYQSE